jgi:hypothetical protein
MAPITDSMVNNLKDQVHDLERRVRDLESSREPGSKKPSASEAMRMILIGPPGAGKQYGPPARRLLLTRNRKGHASSEDQREVLRMPSGTKASYILTDRALI